MIETERGMERIIGNLLRIGVLTTALMVFIGGVIYIYHHGLQLAEYKVFKPVPPELSSVKGIVKSALAWRGRGFIQLGLLLLIATPIARVIFSIWAFARQRDTVYVVITCIVLTILLYSLSGI